MDIWMSSNLGFRRFALRTEPSGLDGAKDMEPRSYLESKPPTSESEVPRMDHVPFFLLGKKFQDMTRKKTWCCLSDAMPMRQCRWRKSCTIQKTCWHWIINIYYFPFVLHPLFWIHCFTFIIVFVYDVYVYISIFYTGRESSTYPHLVYNPGIFRSCKSWKSVKKPSLNWMRCPGGKSGESLQLWPVITGINGVIVKYTIIWIYTIYNLIQWDNNLSCRNYMGLQSHHCEGHNSEELKLRPSAYIDQSKWVAKYFWQIQQEQQC